MNNSAHPMNFAGGLWRWRAFDEPTKRGDNRVRLIVADIFALVCGITGWFYLLYSRAAARLAEVESSRLNARRAKLRRAGGGVMVLLAAAFYWGSNIDGDHRPGTFVLVWISVMILLAIALALALADIRLTGKLRQSLQKRD